jgi:hypothetical protein
MPSINRRSRSATLLAGLTAGAIFIGVVPAVALAGCPTSPVSQPFARFGDSASYTPLQGGSFESGTPGWSLTNASVAKENESYNVAAGSHSLAIAANGVAVSPAFCVSTEQPSFRLFAHRTGGSWGVLNVIVRWTDQSGTTHETTSAALQSGTSWTVSPVLALGTMLPLWQSGQTLSVKLVFKPEPYGGPFAIDDVYIDPYKR